MKAFAAWAVASLLAVGIGYSGSSFAAENSVATGPGAVLRVLAGTAVANAELGQQHARGGIAVNVNGSALNHGTDAGNSVVGSVNGVISNDHAINNNVGLTTVMQNFGNNSIMQQSTTINITIH